MTVKILAVGDVCGEPGLQYLEKNLKAIREERNIRFCIVNGENANVVGVTPKQINMMLQSGADVVTLGNHTWTRTELQPYLNEKRRVLRPANYGPQCPGRGINSFRTEFGDVCVLNLLGRFTLDYNTDNPFVIADGYMQEIREKIILVDFHAEATSEKLAFGYAFDGKVSAVWGTHTHVPTADDMILPDGTGFVTDLGMTGPRFSVLGVKPEQSVSTFRGGLNSRFETAPGPCKLEAVAFTIDTATGRCVATERIMIHE